MPDVLEKLIQLRANLLSSRCIWEALGREVTVRIARERIINEGYPLSEVSLSLGVPQRISLARLLQEQYGEDWYKGGLVDLSTQAGHFITGEQHPRADRQVYTFYHPNGEIFIGTRRALSNTHNIPSGSIDSLVAGSGDSAYGWYLYPITEKEIEHHRSQKAAKARRLNVLGSKAGGAAPKPSKRNPTIHSWLNVLTQERRKATIWEMSKRYKSRAFEAVVSGKIRSNYGWIIDNREITTKVRIQNLRYRFVHRERGIVVGTAHELMKLIGCSQMSISNCVTRKSRGTKGWVFDGLEAEPPGSFDLNDLHTTAIGTRRVIRLSDRKIFNNLSDAAKEVGSKYGHLWATLKLRCRHRGQYYMWHDEWIRRDNPNTGGHTP